MTQYNCFLFNLFFIAVLLSSQKVMGKEYNKGCDSLVKEYKFLHKEFKKKNQIPKEVFYNTIVSIIQNSCSCKYVNSSTLNLFYKAISTKEIKSYIQVKTINDLKFELLQEYNKRFTIEKKYNKSFNIYSSPTKEDLIDSEQNEQIYFQGFNKDINLLFNIELEEQQENQELQIIESKGYNIILWQDVYAPPKSGGGFKLIHSDEDYPIRDFDKIKKRNQMQKIAEKEYEEAKEKYFNELKEKADIFCETNQYIQIFLTFFP